MLKRIENLGRAFQNLGRFATRPLVWVLFSCTLLVSVKVTTLGKSLSEISQTEVAFSFEPNSVHAAQEKNEEKEVAVAAKDVPEKTLEKADSEKVAAEANAEDDKGMENVAEIFDPFSLAATEIDTLQALVKRREEIERRSWVLDARQVEILALEKRVKLELEALRAVQKNVQAIYDKLDQRDDKTTQRLVKMYETMKPKEAARILQALNESVLLELMENMKEFAGSAILAKMDPARAQRLTYQLAQRRDVLDQPTQNQLAEGLAGNTKKTS